MIPFDASINFSTHGLWEDNFDGYIFLGSLDTEPDGEVLYDLYSEDFVKEMDRRAKLFGNDLKESWNIKEVSRAALISKIRQNASTLRWQDVLSQMK